ncbi:MAG: hypothetical protein L6R40_006767 [Gallowayella cf. fulva]|nr:MAG: hypothetical protein L6R40_006767 [Xanthomendoza cf. fulva]
MNVSNLLSHDAPTPSYPLSTQTGLQQHQQRAHQYPTRHSVSNTAQQVLHDPNGPVSHDQGCSSSAQEDLPSYDPSVTTSSRPKNVAFELLFDGPNTRARLPMRVQIFPHDTTDSILTTVKNFYGLYDGAATGVSFEDERGNTLIARHENLRNEMTVYVRVIPDYPQPTFQHGRLGWTSASPISPDRAPHLDEAFQMPPPAQLSHHNLHEPISRPGSRVARKRSVSPRTTRNRRSVSAQKIRSHSGIKSRDQSNPGSAEEPHSDGMNFYSDSDGGGGSVTSSRKARSEQLASAEISVDNIVEGGRRKRAKFESSVSLAQFPFVCVATNDHFFKELPLFVPPQVPAANSISSISPQRRSNGQDNASPFAKPPQRQYTFAQPLPSPQSYGYNEYPHGIVTKNPSQSMPLPVSHGHRLRDRSNPPRQSYPAPAGALSRPQAFGILPTPDPTVASCISDEDVALQLMRLGDASNISHGRTSASTLDDALSGRAEIASSASSDGDDENEDTEQFSHRLPRTETGYGSAAGLPVCPAEHPRNHIDSGLLSTKNMQPSDDNMDGEYQFDERRDGLLKSDPDDVANEYGHAVETKAAGSKALHARSNVLAKKGSKTSKQHSGSSHRKSKIITASSGSKMPLSPASAAPQSRKTSSASTLNFQHHLGVDEEDLSSKPRCQRCRKSKKGCDRQRPCQRCKDAGIGIEGCVSEDEGNGRKGRFGRHMGVSVKKDLQTAADSETADSIPTGMALSSDKSKKRKR